MAQQTQIILIDDIDGGEASETIRFSLDGIHYEIDLSDENAGSLRDDMDRWVTAGRRVSSRSGKKAARTGPDAALVREWAVGQGMQIPARGRVPKDVVAAYLAGHTA